MTISRAELAAMRLRKIEAARESLIDFTELTMPHPDDPGDVRRSLYNAQMFHRALADALERVERGEILRLIITFPPRHGKTELAGNRFASWFVGRDPARHIMFGTYNQPFAEQRGEEVREIMQHPNYGLIFPKCKLVKGKEQKKQLGTSSRGALYFNGRKGSSTGRGGDLLLIDDPFKDSAEARSSTTRDEVWDWFNKTIQTRLMSDLGAIIIIMTRWHEDDLVGRLIDKNNPHYNEQEARQWQIVNFRALAESDDILQREAGAPLWPERFGREYLERFRSRDAVAFEALYQQRPSPADGAFFKVEELPLVPAVPPVSSMRIYAASDFAVATDEQNDRTCHLIAGVDAAGIVWVLDCVWDRLASDKSIDAMIDLQAKWKPLIWWAESGQIKKALGPFLKRRQRERKVYLNVRKASVANDKMTRAQSIQALSANGMVKLPANAPWAARARAELLSFPNGRFDDFVDALAHIGLGIDEMPNAKPRPAAGAGRAKVGTFGWVKEQSDRRKREERRVIQMGGW